MSAHDHGGHSHGHHSHAVVGPDTDARRLGIGLALIVTFMVGEVVAGILADSLALLSDAAHMLTDAGALLLSLIVLRLVRRPARRATSPSACGGRRSSPRRPTGRRCSCSPA